MPQEGYSSVSLPDEQIALIKRLVNRYSHVIGAKSIAEFYFTAASIKIKEAIQLLELKPGDVLET